MSHSFRFVHREKEHRVDFRSVDRLARSLHARHRDQVTTNSGVDRNSILERECGKWMEEVSTWDLPAASKLGPRRVCPTKVTSISGWIKHDQTLSAEIKAPYCRTISFASMELSCARNS